MTELQMLLTFLISISHRYPVKLDIERIQKVLQHVYLNKDNQAFERFLTSLLALDDAIVVGLNTGRFVWDDVGAFSRYPHSFLPKFMRGLLSTVFDDKGNLRNDYRLEDMATIEGLRLVRRTRFQEMEPVAEKRAVEKFVAFQRESRSFSHKVVQDMRQCWGMFAPESLFRTNLQLGFPGPGAMIGTKFPHVPNLCFIDHETIPDDLVRGIMHDALMLKLQTLAFDNGFPDSNYVSIYPFKPSPRVANLSVVPKTCLIGRAITVTDPGSVIIGATLRVSLFNVADSWGWKKVLNVHDQTLSHKTLVNDFKTISLLDLEGGTSCLKLTTMSQIVPDYVDRFLTASKSDYFVLPDNSFVNQIVVPEFKEFYRAELKYTFESLDLLKLASEQMYDDPDLPIEPLSSLDGLERVTTLAQGDASSVALLTITLGLVLALAMYYDDYSSLPLDPTTFILVIQRIRDDGRFHVVGDDMVFPARYEASVRYVLLGLGVTVNERKSSSMAANHKETCGAWAVRLPDGSIKSIYPFRCPDKTNSAVIRQQATQEFIKRSASSANSLELALAVMINVPNDDLEWYESHDLSTVGSPFGIKPPKMRYHTFTDDPAILPDELSYAFGIEPGKCFPKLSNRTLDKAVGFKKLAVTPHPPHVSYARSKRRLSQLCASTVSNRSEERKKARLSQIGSQLEFILAFSHVHRLAIVFS